MSCIEVNKISGYILATKTLWTKRIVRITNHKTHIKRIDNTLYKHLYECKRRGRVMTLKNFKEGELLDKVEQDKYYI